MNTVGQGHRDGQGQAQGHRKCHGSIERIPFRITVLE